MLVSSSKRVGASHLLLKMKSEPNVYPFQKSKYNQQQSTVTLLTNYASVAWIKRHLKPLCAAKMHIVHYSQSSVWVVYNQMFKKWKQFDSSFSQEFWTLNVNSLSISLFSSKPSSLSLWKDSDQRSYWTRKCVSRRITWNLNLRLWRHVEMLPCRKRLCFSVMIPQRSFR